MNSKKKVIIATLLYAFIGLTVFTFANPYEPENILNTGIKNEVTNNNEVTEFFNQNNNNNVENNQENNNNTNEENNNNTNEENNNITPIVDTTYQIALAAVIDAEEKVDEETYEKALELVQLVTATDEKQELSDRLDEVKNGIDVKVLVNTLEKMTNESTNKEELNEARNYRHEENIISSVESLTNEVIKEELQTKLNSLSKLLDDNAVTIGIENNALLNEITKIEITDANELTITLTDKTETKVIENGVELTDGIYTLNVVDGAFNEQTITFTIDTTAPVINLPGTSGINKNELIVESGTEVTYEDLLAMVEDTTADEVIAPYSASLLISNVASENKYNIKDFTNGLDTNYIGRYNIKYTVTDEVGNTTTATMLLVMKDTTAPVINLPGTEGRNKNEMIVEMGTKITYEDLLAMVEDATADAVIAPYNASLLISSTPSENTYNIKNFTNGLDTNYFGRYNIEYTVTDKAGNTTTATMLLMMKDTEKPVLTADIAAGRTYIRGVDKTHLQFNVYKDGELKHSFNSKTSSSGKYFSLSTGWFGDGEYTIEAIDQGNNKTTLKTLVVSNEIDLLKYSNSVTLTKNVSLVELLEIQNGQDKTINLNGNKLIINNTSEQKPFQNNGKLTIKNGTITNESSNTYGIIENNENAKIVLDNVKVDDKGTGTLIKNNGGKVTITNTEITSQNANVTVENIDGDLTVNNTKITIKGIKAYAFWIHNGNVLIENTDIYAVRGGINIYGGNITVNNTNIKLNKSGTTQSYYAIYIANKYDSNVIVNSGTFSGTRAGMYIDTATSLTGKSNVLINGGTFSSTNPSAAAVIFSKAEGVQVTLTIKGGKFTGTTINGYLAEGYKQNDDWTVTEE